MLTTSLSTLSMQIIACPIQVAIDANGNCSDLSGTNGSSVAHYEYTPFGSVAASTGALADANPWQFSTKYYDAETQFKYFGYRYLENGRWISRDPIGERGGIGLYCFIKNDGVNNVDFMGLKSLCDCINTHISVVYRCNWSSFTHANYFYYPVSDGDSFTYYKPHNGLLGLRHKDYVNFVDVTVLPTTYDNGVVRYDPEHCECGAGDLGTLPYKPHVKITGPWARTEWLWDVSYGFGDPGYDTSASQIVLMYDSPFASKYTVEVFIEDELCSKTTFTINY